MESHHLRMSTHVPSGGDAAAPTADERIEAEVQRRLAYARKLEEARQAQRAKSHLHPGGGDTPTAALSDHVGHEAGGGAASPAAIVVSPSSTVYHADDDQVGRLRDEVRRRAVAEAEMAENARAEEARRHQEQLRTQAEEARRHEEEARHADEAERERELSERQRLADEARQAALEREATQAQIERETQQELDNAMAARAADVVASQNEARRRMAEEAAAVAAAAAAQYEALVMQLVADADADRLAISRAVDAANDVLAAEQIRLAEECRIEAEVQRAIADEEDAARRAEATKAAEEARLAQVVRLEQEARLAEEARIEAEVQRELQEQQRVEQATIAEQRRIDAAARLAAELEEARIEAEVQRALAEQRARDEHEARIAEEASLLEEARVAEEARIEAEVQRALAEQQAKVDEEARRAEEERLLAEQLRLAEEARIEAEVQRALEEEARAAERAHVAFLRAAETSRASLEEQLAEQHSIDSNKLLAEHAALLDEAKSAAGTERADIRAAAAKREAEARKLDMEARIRQEVAKRLALAKSTAAATSPSYSTSVNSTAAAPVTKPNEANDEDREAQRVTATVSLEKKASTAAAGVVPTAATATATPAVGVKETPSGPTAVLSAEQRLALEVERRLKERMKQAAPVATAVATAAAAAATDAIVRNTTTAAVGKPPLATTAASASATHVSDTTPSPPPRSVSHAAAQMLQNTAIGIVTSAAAHVASQPSNVRLFGSSSVAASSSPAKPWRDAPSVSSMASPGKNEDEESDAEETGSSTSQAEDCLDASEAEGSDHDSDTDAVGSGRPPTVSALFGNHAAITKAALDINTSVVSGRRASSNKRLVYFVVDDCPFEAYQDAMKRRYSSASRDTYWSTGGGEPPSGGGRDGRAVGATSVATYATRQEDGKCTGPLPAEERFSPTLTHHAILLGYFASKQYLVLKQSSSGAVGGGLTTSSTVALVSSASFATQAAVAAQPSVVFTAGVREYRNPLVRKRPARGRQAHEAVVHWGGSDEAACAPLSLDARKLTYEADVAVVTQDGSAQSSCSPFAVDASVEGLIDAAATTDAAKAALEDPSNVTAPLRALHCAANRLPLCDPIHLFIKARGLPLNTVIGNGGGGSGAAKGGINAASPGGTGPSSGTSNRAATTSGLWCGDYDATNKPIPAPPTYTGGILTRFEITQFTTQTHAKFGADCDPLFGTAAPYLVNGTSLTKIGETFHFSNGGATPFLPGVRVHAAHQFNQAVTFIPSELRYAKLIWLIRIFRLCPDEGEPWVDVYYRPTRYNSSNISSYRQKTITNASVMLNATGTSRLLLTEVGWTSLKLTNAGRLLEGEGTLDKLYMSPKNTSDATLAEFVTNEMKRDKTLYVCPIDLKIRITDVSKHEYSVPHSGPNTSPIEEESVIMLQDVEKLGAARIAYRHLACIVPYLNSGCFKSYTNLFYVRLEALNLTKLVTRATGPMKSFVVRVTLKEIDDTLEAGQLGLNNAYQVWTSGSLCDRCHWSAVTFGEKDVQFADEFKFQLPLVLTERHHLVFHVFSVWLKPGQPTLTPVAVAVFPIFAKATVVVQERIRIPVANIDVARTCGSGYLMGMSQIPPSAFVSGGEPILSFSTSMRSTVYALNAPLAANLARLPLILNECVKGGYSTDPPSASWFRERCGDMVMSTAPGAADNLVTALCQTLVQDTPVADSVAFFPALVSSLLAIVAAPSRTIGIAARVAALKSFVELASRVESLEQTTIQRAAAAANYSPTRGGGGSPLTKVGGGRQATTLQALLYHFFTNDLLFDGGQTFFPVAEALAEVLEADLRVTCASNAAVSYLKKLADLSWFFMDFILKSLYVRGGGRSSGLEAPPLTPQRSSSTSNGMKPAWTGHAVSPSFWKIAASLITQLVIRFLKTIAGTTPMVCRIAIFVRNLLLASDGNGGALRCIVSLLSALEQHTSPSMVQSATKMLLEADQLVAWSLPSRRRLTPRFYLRAILTVVVPQLVGTTRDIRWGAANTLMTFLARTGASDLSDAHVTALASAMFPIIVAVGADYDQLKVTMEKQAASITTGSTGTFDKRMLLVNIVWLLHRLPRHAWRVWLAAANPVVLRGILVMLADAAAVFRTTFASIKPAPGKTSDFPDATSWAQLCNTVAVVCARTLAYVLQDHAPQLRTVSVEKSLPSVFPFFSLLDGVCSLAVPTVALQLSAALYLSVARALIPEITSERARMLPGMVLLCTRMMTSMSPSVRRTAAYSFADLVFAFAATHHNSVERLRQPFTTAVVTVAEAPRRSMQQSLQWLTEAFDVAKAVLASYVNLPDGESAFRGKLVAVQAEWVSRHHRTIAAVAVTAQPPLATSSSSGGVPPATPTTPFHASSPLGSSIHFRTGGPCSVRPFVNLPSGMLQSASFCQDASPPASATCYGGLSDEFDAFTTTGLELFSTVVRLQVDASLRYPALKGLAYADIVKTFLRQKSVKEVVKWLGRLHDLHRSNGDNVEAGAVLILLAGFGYRVTQFYYMKYGGGPGVFAESPLTHPLRHAGTPQPKLPRSFFERIFWHDYVRAFPDLPLVFPDVVIAGIVDELTALPEEKCFTVEGQTTMAKEAAEWYGRGSHFEYAMNALRIVQEIVHARDDFKSTAVVVEALMKWANGITGGSNSRRLASRYYYVTAVFSALAAEQYRRNNTLVASASTPAGDERSSASATPKFQYVFRCRLDYDVTTFARTMRGMMAAMLNCTEDAVAVDLNGGTAQPKKGGGAMQHCTLVVYEVQPFFEEGDPRGLPNAKIQDRYCHISTFQYAMRVTDPGEAPRPPPMTRAQAQALSSAARSLDVAKQRLKIVAHRLDRSFPSYTLAIPVSASSETSLDPFQTCLETLQQQSDRVEAIALPFSSPAAKATNSPSSGGPTAAASSSSPPSPPPLPVPQANGLIQELFLSLTPLDVHPAGYYFKEVVKVFGHRRIVHAALLHFLGCVKARLERASNVAADYAERYAAVFKATIDLECALAEAESRLEPEKPPTEDEGEYDDGSDTSEERRRQLSCPSTDNHTDTALPSPLLATAAGGPSKERGDDQTGRVMTPAAAAAAPPGSGRQPPTGRPSSTSTRSAITVSGT